MTKSKASKISARRAAKLGVKTASIAAQKGNQPKTRNANGSIKRQAASMAVAIRPGNGDQPETLPAVVAAASSMVLMIGSRPVITGQSIETLQACYTATRDESGEGASTFEEGRIFANGVAVARISYNGNVWDQADTLIRAAKFGEWPAAPDEESAPVVAEELAPAQAITVPLKFLHAALLVAAKKDVRYYLNGVYLHQLEDGQVRLVSTDGHRMFVVNLERQAETIDWLRAGAILPADDLARIAKFVDKGAVLEISFGLKHPTMLLSQPGDIATFRVVPVDGKYPDYQRIVDRSAEVFTAERAELETASIDGAYLRGAGQLAAALGSKSVLPFLGVDNAASVFLFGGCQEAVLYVMSLKGPSECLPATTIKLFSADAMQGTIRGLREQVKVSAANAKRTKVPKFREQSLAKVRKLNERIEQLEAALRPKLEGPAAPAAAAQADEKAAA